VSPQSVAAIAMIATILASGSHTVIGLYVAVAVAVFNGIAWFLWAGTAASGRRR
jgi:hypothetical protein